LLNTRREVAKLAALQLQSALYMLDGFVRSWNVQKHRVRFVVHFSWPTFRANISVVNCDVFTEKKESSKFYPGLTLAGKVSKKNIFYAKLRFFLLASLRLALF
jgi:hypothetical protein